MHWESRDPTQTYRIGQAQGSKSLYQIGKELRLVRTCVPQPTDSAERAAKRVNGMKVAVSRMLVRANNLSANAAVGVFPSVQELDIPIVWRPIQQRKMAEAVAAGLWQPRFEDNHMLNVQQPDDLLL